MRIDFEFVVYDNEIGSAPTSRARQKRRLIITQISGCQGQHRLMTRYTDYKKEKKNPLLLNLLEEWSQLEVQIS